MQFDAMMKLLGTVILVGGALLSSCGDGSGGGGTGGNTGGATNTGGGDITIECGDYAVALCARTSECHLFLDMDDPNCVSRVGSECVAMLGLPGVTISAADVKACAEGLSVKECGRFLEFRANPCDFSGSREDGASCSFGAQCKGSFCIHSSREACGECATGNGMGFPCSVYNGEVCVRDAVCNFDVCTPPPGEGEQCSEYCAEGLTCTDYLCAEPLSDGAACFTGKACDWQFGGYYCDTYATNTCRKIGHAAIGGLCGLVPETYLMTVCPRNAWCDIFDTWTCIQSDPEGASCPKSEFNCDVDLLCLSSRCTAGYEECQ